MGHALRVIKYGLLEPALSVAVNHANPLFGGGVAPPRWMNFAGGGDFEAVGRENVTLLTEHADLQPDSRVMEIGCGIGRNAAILAEFLSKGEYDGFDVVRTGIHWCRNRISQRHSRFRFHRVDVRNGFYNPFGRINPTEFCFPFRPAQFDLIFATSVFTHMLHAETAHYIEQSRRVLVAGGRLLFTAFVLTDRSRGLCDQGKSNLSFADTHGDNRVEFGHSPHLGVAYDESQIEQLLSSNGFRLIAMHPGSWSGEQAGGVYQDVVVATTE